MDHKSSLDEKLDIVDDADLNLLTAYCEDTKESRKRLRLLEHYTRVIRISD